MLNLNDVHAWYGKSHVLQGVSLVVRPGEIVSLLGRNGSGRSTLLKTVMGLVANEGVMRLQGSSIAGRKPFEVARLGVGYVPENREVFGGLTVEQNLLLGRKPGSVEARAAWSLDDVYRMFPHLLARRYTRAGVLSGGEQQMLTLCRTLMGNPVMMLIDEPTEGLAPALVEQIASFLLQLRERGVSVLLVEQKLTIALAISERCYVMGRGRIVFEGTPAELSVGDAVRSEWLEV
ncbi:ABC transporter ATP-binding protein [soil metagenome]